MSYNVTCLSDFFFWQMNVLSALFNNFVSSFSVLLAGNDWKNCWLSQDVIDDSPFEDFKMEPSEDDHFGIIYLKFNFFFNLFKVGKSNMTGGRHEAPITITLQENDNDFDPYVKQKPKKFNLVEASKLKVWGRDVLNRRRDNGGDEELRVFVVTPYVILFEKIMQAEIEKEFQRAFVPGSCQEEIYSFKKGSREKNPEEVVEIAIRIMYKVARYVNSLDSTNSFSTDECWKFIKRYNEEKVLSLVIDKEKSKCEYSSSSIRRQFDSAQWKIGQFPEGVSQYVETYGYKFGSKAHTSHTHSLIPITIKRSPGDCSAHISLRM